VSTLVSSIVARLRAAGCVFAEDEARLLMDAAQTSTELDAMVRRRVEGEPLEVIVGWAEFRGLRIIVEAGVFVPRQRSAFLVQQAVELARPGAVVVDLCCGSGALGAAVAAELGRLELHASDIDPVAVRCARRNLETFNGQVHHGDLYAPLPAALRGRVDILVVNAPYVPSDEIDMMPPEARDHEPRAALDGGPDGVDLHRRVAAEAVAWLAPGGHLLIETSRDQAALTAGVMSGHGLATRVTTSEEPYCTVAIGTKAVLLSDGR
jgi:release factor glutamine methyltransferase